MTNPAYPGILLEARPIALLKMKDTYETDDKYTALQSTILDLRATKCNGRRRAYLKGNISFLSGP
jgi:inorganic pyrophosphatase